jgi:glycosyltransferase involved in cell wall biosynthesis
VRILAIVTYYHPHWTGLTAFATRISEGLAARGHEVTVLTTRHDRALAAREVVRGVRLVRLEPAAFVSRGAITPAFPLRLASLVRRHDVVHMHTPLPEALLVAVACRLAARPLVMTHHGDLVMPAGFSNRVVERSVTAMMSGAARLATRVTTLSADYAAHSAFLAPVASKLQPISPPIDIPCPDAAASAVWRRELGLADARVIGFAGRFVEEKGFDYLLRALPALVRREPRVRLAYAGDHQVYYERFFDACRPLLEPLADRVSFVGLQRDRQRLANFYAMCDAFALPSRTDCLAAVQVEAMLCGTPVVASDIPGAREVVTRTGMGTLVPPRNPPALAEALANVLNAPDRYVKPRAHIRSIYDPDRSIGEHEAVLDQAVQSRRRS